MANLIAIEKITIDSKNLHAQVRLEEGLPLLTSQNIEATARVYWLMPEIAEHACFGDLGTTFQNVMGDTELAHLLEHVAVELIARTTTTQAISCGKTRELSEPRTYHIELACPDDVLCSAALVSAADIVQWAFAEKDAKNTPDIASIVDGITYMVEKSFELEKAQVGESVNVNLTSKVSAPQPTEVASQPSVDTTVSSQPTESKESKADVEKPISQEGLDVEDLKVLKFDVSKIPGNRPL